MPQARGPQSICMYYLCESCTHIYLLHYFAQEPLLLSLNVKGQAVVGYFIDYSVRLRKVPERSPIFRTDIICLRD